MMDKTLFDEMIQTRRLLHTIPEEGWTEFHTTYIVVERLKDIGYTDIRTGKAIINPEAVMGRNPDVVKKGIERAESEGVPAEFIESIDEYTGCVAVLDTGRPGPVTAFRFDMDCNPVEETHDPEHVPNKLGFRSTHPGFMHACGHDGHTALGLAVARWLMQNKDELTGTFKLVFQPAEEGVRGANAIAASGVLDDVNTIVGSHCGGVPKLHEVGILRKGVLASTKFDIYFTGTPSHAGNNPHKGHSALMAASATSMMLVGIPRHGEGATRVAVGRMVAGEGRNVTPVHAYIQMEVRGETAEINDYLCDKVEKIVKGNAEAYEVDYRIERVGEATTIVECPEVLDTLEEIAHGVEGVTKVINLDRPAGSEDFTMLLKRVVDHGGRGGMFRWGCNHHGHHRADFDLQDTESMPIGFEVFTRYAKKTNGKA
ncbi:MAG TPA: amidohydrolase [Candidatus Aphodousia gallistercoris]|nr:amidohydrolase [Candidatus Aphodousia gallistercoris]